jgi:hypothetical protein
MTNPSDTHNQGTSNRSQQDLNTRPIDFVIIFDNSKEVDKFLRFATQELPNRSDIQLFVISENEIIDQNTTKFELRFNIFIHNSNNNDRNELFLGIIKPAIHHACHLVKSKSNKVEQIPSHSNEVKKSWDKTIQETITNKYFIMLFPFIGFILFLMLVIFTGEPNKSNINPPLNPSPQVDNAP